MSKSNVKKDSRSAKKPWMKNILRIISVSSKMPNAQSPIFILMTMVYFIHRIMLIKAFQLSI